MGSDARSRSRSALCGASVLVDVVVGDDEVVVGVLEAGVVGGGGGVGIA